MLFLYVVAVVLQILETTLATDGSVKCEQNEFRCGNGLCITDTFQCDGYKDCLDGSDEIGCRKIKCPYDDQFRCGYNGRCIHKQWVCNGVKNCIDGSDEADDVCKPTAVTSTVQTTVKLTTAATTRKSTTAATSSTQIPVTISTTKTSSVECGQLRFRCGNGLCIAITFQCDGHKDCLDGTDEIGCRKIKCPYDDQFRCGYNGRCIHKQWVCNGVKNCIDGSDEAVGVCKTEATTTKSNSQTTTKMISTTAATTQKLDKKATTTAEARLDDTSNLADGKRDCGGGEYKCGDGNCIKDSYKCDGMNNCNDGTDETGCAKIKCPYDDQFRCGYNGRCIHKQWVCNGVKNCIDGSDEAATICIGKAANTSRLQQTDQVPTTSTSATTTKKLTTITMNPRHDELKLRQDALASYPLPELLIAMGSDVRQIRNDGQHYKILLHSHLVESVTSVDIDVKCKIIYIADRGRKSIVRVPIGNINNMQRIVEDVLSLEGIAYDWVSKKIYWSSYHPKYQGAIEVANSDGSSRSVLVHTHVDRPRAVALHPFARYLFWTDWGEHPRIERVSMDGLQREVIINSDHITWPNGLTIDYTSDRIFWADSKRDYIGSSDLDGANVVIVAKDVPNPYGLAVFEDLVYWTSYEGNQVFHANKMNGTKKHEYEMKFSSPVDLQIFHSLLQRAGDDPCEGNNGGCSHLCLPSAVKNEGYSCACPTDITLNPDGKHCDFGAESGKHGEIGIVFIAIIATGVACLFFVILALLLFVYKRNSQRASPSMPLHEERDAEEACSLREKKGVSDGCPIEMNDVEIQLCRPLSEKAC